MAIKSNCAFFDIEESEEIESTEGSKAKSTTISLVPRKAIS